MKRNETLEEYFDKMNSDNVKIELPKPKSDWDEERLDVMFEKINSEYNIYDSHNPKV